MEPADGDWKKGLVCSNLIEVSTCVMANMVKEKPINRDW